MSRSRGPRARGAGSPCPRPTVGAGGGRERSWAGPVQHPTRQQPGDCRTLPTACVWYPASAARGGGRGTGRMPARGGARLRPRQHSPPCLSSVAMVVMLYGTPVLESSGLPRTWFTCTGRRPCETARSELDISMTVPSHGRNRHERTERNDVREGVHIRNPYSPSKIMPWFARASMFGVARCIERDGTGTALTCTPRFITPDTSASLQAHLWV